MELTPGLKPWYDTAMSDYNDSDFDGASAGYWLITYGDGFPPSGPYDSVREMAEANGLFTYPEDGYVVYREADGSMGSVPSLNPDDLIPLPLPEGAEALYRKFYAVPDFEEVDRWLVFEWYEGGAGL